MGERQEKDNLAAEATIKEIETIRIAVKYHDRLVAALDKALEFEEDEDFSPKNNEIYKQINELLSEIEAEK
jgi:hypothetical protein